MLQVLRRWRDGTDGAIVAPFARLTLLELPVVVVVPDDGAALLLAATEGGHFLANGQSPAERAAVLEGAGEGPVVVSVDSLHSEAVRRALREGLAGVPWCSWYADLIDRGAPGHAGRGAWLERHRQDAGGGSLLTRHADAGLAPGGTPVQADGATGPIWEADEALGLDHALVPEHAFAATQEAWGAAGKPVHEHAGSDQGAARELLAKAVRRAAPGLHAAPTEAPPPSRGWLLAGPARSACELAGAAPRVLAPAPNLPATPSVDVAAAGERVAAAWAECGAARVLTGDVVDVADLELLEAAGWITDVRPTRLTARLADVRRFGAPLVDVEPSWRRLLDDYERAQAGWGPAEQARLALSDEGPFSLTPLAEVLGRSPAELGDLLDGLSAGDLLLGRRTATGSADWQLCPTPRWGVQDEATGIILEAWLERRGRHAAAAAVVPGPEACRGQALAVHCGVPAAPCGRCVACGSRSRWKTRRAKRRRSGADAGEEARAPRVAVPQPAALVADLQEGAGPAIDAVGGIAPALLLAGWSYRGPEGPLPQPETAERILTALAHEIWPARDTASKRAEVVRRSEREAEVRLRKGQEPGTHRLKAREGLAEVLLLPAAAVFRRARDQRDAWQAAVRLVSNAVSRLPERWLPLTQELLHAAVAEAGRGWAAEDVQASPSPEAGAAPASPSLEPGAAAEDAPDPDLLAALVLGDAAAADAALADVPTRGVEAADRLLVEAVVAALGGRWGDLASSWPLRPHAGPAQQLRAELIGRAARTGRVRWSVEPLSQWLDWAEAGLADPATSASLAEAALELVGKLTKAEPSALFGLVRRFAARGWPTDPLVKKALQLEALPAALRGLLLPAALQASDGELAARIIAASVADGGPAAALAAMEGLAPESAALVEDALATLDTPRARELLGFRALRTEALARAAEVRAAVLAADAAGEASSALEGLAELTALQLRAGVSPGGDPGISAVRERLAGELRQRVSAIEAAAEAGLEASGSLRAAAGTQLESIDAAWLPIVGAVLAEGGRATDPGFALWRARLLVVSKRWVEARATLAVVQRAASSDRWAGVVSGLLHAALEDGEVRRAAAWAAAEVAGPPSRALASVLVELIGTGRFDAPALESIAEAVQARGLPIYAGVERALEKAQRS